MKLAAEVLESASHAKEPARNLSRQLHELRGLQPRWCPRETFGAFFTHVHPQLRDHRKVTRYLRISAT